MSRHRRAALAVLAGSVLAGAAFAPAAEAKTLRVYERTVAGGASHADGTPIPNQSGPPAVGDRFFSVSRLYAGTRQKHGKKVIGFDHVTCTVTALPTGPGDAGGGLECDASLFVRGGMIYIDRQAIPFADRFTIKVTGVGSLRRAKTLTQTATGDNWANLVIRD